LDWLIAYLDQFTYFGIALTLFVAGLGVPIPEDIPLIFGGAMAGAGKINVWVHFAISMAFILIGDACLFAIGRRIGTATSGGNGRLARMVTPERREKVFSYFEKYGAWTVFFGRFVAGIRGAVFLTAGAVRFPFWRFVLLDALAALISVPVWIYLGYYFGQNWTQILEKAKGVQTGVFIVLGVLAVGGWIWFKLAKRRRAAAARSVRTEADGGEEEQRLGDEADERLARRQAVGGPEAAYDHHQLNDGDQELPPGQP
jgi:membrane protein DedA with SNARE-associated domain